MGIHRSLALLALALSLAAQAKNPTFSPAAESVEEAVDVSHKGAFASGFYFNSLYLMNNPFRNGLSGEQDFRFQVPLGFGVEASYSPTPSWDVGLNGGYEQYSTRVLTIGRAGIQ
jgi:hypothetical protein